MALQHIEDMNEMDIECLVSVLLETDPKAAKEMKPETKEPFCIDAFFGQHHQGGFRLGELNIICSGRNTK